jgi:hypothetical protein
MGTHSTLGSSSTPGASSPIYDAIMGRLRDTEFFGAGGRPAESLFTSNQDKIINDLIPLLPQQNMSAFTSNNPWYAGYLIASALTGRPYYNPDTDKNIGNLKALQGYAPAGAPATVQKYSHDFPFYWMG